MDYMTKYFHGHHRELETGLNMTRPEPDYRTSTWPEMTLNLIPESTWPTWPDISYPVLSKNNNRFEQIVLIYRFCLIVSAKLIRVNGELGHVRSRRQMTSHFFIEFLTHPPLRHAERVLFHRNLLGPSYLLLLTQSVTSFVYDAYCQVNHKSGRARFHVLMNLNWNLNVTTFQIQVKLLGTLTCFEH